MEVNDWHPGGKESFTTPGGRFRPPADGSGKSYSFERPGAARRTEPVRPAPREPEPERRTAPASPFLPTPPRTVRPAAASQGSEASSAAPELDGGAVRVLGPAPGGAPVYTIQLPGAAPRQAAKRRGSLWWVPVLLLTALLLGLLLGVLLYSVMRSSAAAARPTEPAASGLTEQQIYRENLPSVVTVTAVKATSGGTGSVGSGFIISADGYVLTSGHVAAEAESLLVTLSSGQRYLARLVALEREHSDLALLKIPAGGLKTVTIGNSDALEVGERICTIGNPTGNLEFSLSTGVVSATAREIQAGTAALSMFQTNAAFNKGNSGGPVFDGSGRVVGVATAKLSSSGTETLEGLGFALPINEVMELAEPWMRADRAPQ